jgi:hypothetical protein
MSAVPRMLTGGCTTRRRANTPTLATIPAVAASVLLATQFLVVDQPAAAPGAEPHAVSVEIRCSAAPSATGILSFDDPSLPRQGRVLANPDYADQGI